MTGGGKKSVDVTRMKPPTFSGKARDYHSFESRFQETITNKFDEMAQLYFLEEALPQSVKEKISMVRKTPQEVWNQLDKIYKDPRVVVAEAMKDLHEVDHKKLGNRFMTRMAIMLEDTETLLAKDGQDDYLRHPMEVNALQKLLPQKEKLGVCA